MTTELRKIGISVLGEMPWGVHFCHFYETKQDLLDIVIPYYKTGLENQEFCLWVLPKLLSREEAIQALRQAVPDLELYLTDGSLEILLHQEWFLQGDSFDLPHVIERLKHKLVQVLARGYAGIRLNGDTFWLLKKDSKAFHEYEAELDNLITNQPMLVLCSFGLVESSAADILDATHTHQFGLIQRQGNWDIVETHELKQAKAEIMRLNEQLEQQVVERTQELTAVNVALRNEITERRQVEAELRKQKEILQKIIDHIPVMIRFLGEDGQVKLINQEWAHTIGWSLEELVTQNVDIFAECYPDPQYRQNVLNRIAASTGEWADFKTRVRDGRVIDTSWANIHLSDGTSIDIGLDITARKRTEEQIRLQAQVIEQIQAAVILIDMSGAITYWNRQAEKLYGWRSEEILGRPLSSLLVGPTNLEMARQIMEQIKTVGFWEGEFVVKRKDGSTFPAYVIDTVIRDGRGQPLAIIGFSLDITERKQVEGELRKQKEIFQMIFDHLPVMINFVDKDGHIKLVNREWERTLGWSLDEITEQNLDIFTECYPEQYERQEVLNFLAGNNGIWSDFKPKSKNGRRIDSSWYIVHLSDGTRIGIGTDITERKRIEDAEREQRVLAEALRDTAAALNSNLDFEKVVDGILENLGRVVPHDSAALMLAETDRLWVAGHRGFTERGLKEWVENFTITFDQHPIFQEVVETSRPFRLPNFQTSSIVDKSFKLPWVSSYLSSPILVKGKVIGLLNLHSSIPNFFNQDHTNRLQAFADQAAIALQNAQLLKEVNTGQERLQSLSKQLLEAQEAERRFIARELHDQIGQILTAIGTNLRILALSSGTIKHHARLEETLRLVDEALELVRNLSFDLRPSVLDHFGLVSALKWYLERKAQSSELKIEIVAEPSVIHLSPDLETTCFRVAQIGLTNVVRHAQARHVRVKLCQQEQELQLLIQDDGIGFDVPAALARATSGVTLGLLIMQERVRLVGGKLEIKSGPGLGTQVQVSFPTD